MLRSSALIAAAVSTVLATLAPPAHAAFPGANGRVSMAIDTAVVCAGRLGCTYAHHQLTVDPVTGARRDFSFRVGTISSPTYSPDGKRMAAVLQRDSVTQPEAFYGLPDGPLTTPVVNAAGTPITGIESLSFTPSGKLLINSASGVVSIQDANRRDPRVIYTPPAGVDAGTEARLSPDGTTLAVTGYDADFAPHLYLVDAATGTISKTIDIARSTPLFGFDWSPDSRRLALAEDGLILLDVDTGTRSQLVANPIGRLVADVAWAPAGDQLAFTRLDETDRYSLETVNADATNGRRLLQTSRQSELNDLEWRRQP